MDLYLLLRVNCDPIYTMISTLKWNLRTNPHSLFVYWIELFGLNYVNHAYTISIVYNEIDESTPLSSVLNSMKLQCYKTQI